MENLKSGDSQLLVSQTNNPYQENGGRALKRDPSKKSNGSSKHGRTKQSEVAKSVAFGTSERRRINDPTTELIQDLSTYNYIPDLRQLNAISSTQMKDQRAAKMTEMKRMRSQKSLKNDAEATPLKKQYSTLVTDFG